MVRSIYLMMRQQAPEDFALASGESRSVRQFVEAAFKEIGVELKCFGSLPPRRVC